MKKIGCLFIALLFIICIRGCVFVTDELQLTNSSRWFDGFENFTPSPRVTYIMKSDPFDELSAFFSRKVTIFKVEIGEGTKNVSSFSFLK